MDEGYVATIYKMLWHFHARLLNLERVLIGNKYADDVNTGWTQSFDYILNGQNCMDVGESFEEQHGVR